MDPIHAVPIRSFNPATNMEYESSLTLLNESVVDVAGQEVNGDENNNSAISVTCHQCRRPKMEDLVARCKNPRNGKPCVLKYCYKCLVGRYAVKDEDVIFEDWKCPKCKGNCNCSICMKKNGKKPTGALAKTAKASGFTSVADMLSKTTSEDLEAHKVNNVAVLPRINASSEKMDVENHDTIHDQMDGPLAWCANDFFFDPTTFTPISFNVNPTTSGVNVMHQINVAGDVTIVNSHVEKIKEEIPLPLGTKIEKMLDMDFPSEEVGKAMQYLEFCRVFGEALNMKNGDAEEVLQELIRRENTSIVEYQIKLLTLTVSNSGINIEDNSWLKFLEDLITESNLLLKDFPMDWLKEGISGYFNLDLSKKLSLLNFLCDEALGSEKLRDYIKDQNIKFAEKEKEARSKVSAAKVKEKTLKQKLTDETAKGSTSDVANLSISEPRDLLLKMKSDVAKAHTELLEAEGTIDKWKQFSDAVRIEPEFSNGSGQMLWKLKSYNDENALLMQDITVKHEDDAAAAANEKWLSYGPEQKDEIDIYISSRAKRPKTRKRKVPCILANESSEENI